MVKKIFLTFLFFLMSAFLAKKTMATSFIVQKNMTLSEIAAEHFKGDIFGPNGSLEKLIKLNPQIVNPHLIYPGQVIQIAPAVADETPFEAESKMVELDGPDVTEEQIKRIIAAGNEEIEKAKGPVGKRHLIFTPKLLFSALKSKDRETQATADIPSALSPGFRVDYLQRWSEKTAPYVFLGLKQIQWEKFDDRSISGEKANYSELGLGFLYGDLITHSLFAEISLAQDPFLRAKDVDHLSVERKARLNLAIGGEKRILQQDPFSLFIGGRLGYLGRSKAQNYTIEAGHFYQLDLTLRDQLTPKLYLDVTGYYMDRKIDTSIAEQQYEEIGLRAAFNFQF